MVDNPFVSLAGNELPVTVDGDTITIGGAEIVEDDIFATNGVIHVIDTVLAPNWPQLGSHHCPSAKTLGTESKLMPDRSSNTDVPPTVRAMSIETSHDGAAPTEVGNPEADEPGDSRRPARPPPGDPMVALDQLPIAVHHDVVGPANLLGPRRLHVRRRELAVVRASSPTPSTRPSNSTANWPRASPSTSRSGGSSSSTRRSTRSTSR